MAEIKVIDKNTSIKCKFQKMLAETLAETYYITRNLIREMRDFCENFCGGFWKNNGFLPGILLGTWENSLKSLFFDDQL